MLATNTLSASYVSLRRAVEDEGEVAVSRVEPYPPVSATIIKGITDGSILSAQDISPLKDNRCDSLVVAKIIDHRHALDSPYGIPTLIIETMGGITIAGCEPAEEEEEEEDEDGVHNPCDRQQQDRGKAKGCA